MTDLILIVDDEQDILDGMAVALRGRFNLQTALGPEQGLEMVRSFGPYAVVVSDLKMPGMNGIDFLAKVREISPATMRIMLTGHGDIDSAIEAVNRGEVFRFFTKPCPSHILQDALILGLDKYQSNLGPGVYRPDEHALTMRELKIAEWVRAGESSKDIAEKMNLSTRTVETYRDNIRKKLGISNKKVNLHSFLNSAKS
jgi:DNA-binding NarL/FixJ family response regulator